MQLKDLHPAALREIERAMKNDLIKKSREDAGSGRENLHGKNNTEEAQTAEEKHPGSDSDRADRTRRRSDPRRGLDRRSDPDIGTA